jgi:2-polyprenyl-6-methoxyphenol hydroxylase-like FAD-dependent oxidoreductase
MATNGPVIVVGASMAGLLAARAMAEHADHVVVLERDPLAAGSGPRRGVPQGRHAHAILAAGLRRIEGWFPGFSDELVAGGAVAGDGGDAIWWQAGALKVRADVGVRAISASRPMLEAAVRRRLLATPGVEIRSGAGVGSLQLEGDRVTGVVADGAVVRAQLVIDATGRNTRLLGQLAAAGHEAPKTSQVVIDMSYATRLLPRTAGDIGAMYCVVAPTPPGEDRFGVLLPIEGDRWILTMGGFHGDRAPTDDAGYLQFARSLPHPAIAELLARVEPLSEVMTHRLASNQRRHFERLGRVPAGYVAIGDAVCSFNPIYGQGMSSAALQAEALAGVAARYQLDSAALGRAFYRRAAKVVNNPWQIAAGSDFLHPATTGPKPAGTAVINRYVAKVQLATHVSAAVLAEMQKVQNLLAPPPSLMRPATMVKVLRAARRSPARHRATAAPAPPLRPAVSG